MLFCVYLFDPQVGYESLECNAVMSIYILSESSVKLFIYWGYCTRIGHVIPW